MRYRSQRKSETQAGETVCMEVDKVVAGGYALVGTGFHDFCLLLDLT